MTLEIQSIIFDKHKWSKKTASSWLKKHGYIAKKVDETTNFYRYRQKEPYKYDRYVSKDIYDGIQFILGIYNGSHSNSKTWK